MRIEERMMPDTEETFDDMPECRRAVQRLYDVCKATFTRNGGPFSAQALQRVRSLLDNIRPSDVGLNEGLTAHGQKAKGFPPISYLPIYECEDFSMAIFCLPTSAVIPLHNHPGMTVLSKLLYGSMHVKAYDWVDHSDSSHPRLAKLAVDRLMSAPCESAVLYPRSGGNMHVFTAVTSCAVLDVLAPPYSSEDGRHCTYYRALPYASHAGPLFEDEREDRAHQNFAWLEEIQPPDDFAWLEEIQPPDDFVMQGALYKGPEITP